MKQSHLAIRWQLWIVTIGFFMQFLDITAVNTALPTIAASLHHSQLDMQSVIVAYAITVALFLPASGWLSDKFGTKWIFLGSIIIFSLGSLFCALSQTWNQLIAARIFEGIGGAMLVPVARLIVLRVVPREEYISAMSFVALTGQFGALLGPTLGGLLTQYADWHWIFVINLPFGVLGALLVFFYLPNSRLATQAFDSLGYLLTMVAMLCVVIGFNGGRAFHLTKMELIGLAIIFVTVVSYYIVHAKQHARPLFNLNLFKFKNYIIGLSGNMVARIGGGTIPFLTPILLEVGLGFSTSRTGFMMLPLIIGSIVIKPYVARIVKWAGYRYTLVGCSSIIAINTALMPFAALYRHDTLFLVMLFIQGVTNSIRFTTMGTLTLIDLPKELSSGGNCLMSMFMQVSLGISVTLASLLLDGFSPKGTMTVAASHEMFFLSYAVIGLIMLLPNLLFIFAPHHLLPLKPVVTESNSSLSANSGR